MDDEIDVVVVDVRVIVTGTLVRVKVGDNVHEVVPLDVYDCDGSEYEMVGRGDGLGESENDVDVDKVGVCVGVGGGV
jgi:hypothetical protein